MIPLPPDANHFAVRRGGVWTIHPADASQWPHTRVIYPGAFDPLHAGHRRIAQITEQRTGRATAFEISLENVDKPPLSEAEIRRRVEQFPREAILWLTRAPTFVEKSRLSAGCTFVVGADTLARIADLRYYDGQPRQLAEAVRAIAANGCRFLVFGRLIGTRFCSVGELELPRDLRALCEAIPPEQFRLDISSTELRARDST
jgi:nicotinic acid mononucleotide adenylyltransferase